MRIAKELVIALTASFLIIAGVGYGFLKAETLSARNKPGPIEYSVATYALAFAIPAESRTTTNPVNKTAESLSDGGKYYAENCQVCHANNGSGDTKPAKGLSPGVPDLRSDRVQKLSDGEMFYIIKNGVRFTGMPATDLSDEGIWKLVLVIRQLAPQKPSAKAAGKKNNKII